MKDTVKARKGYKVKVLPDGVVILNDGETLIDVYALKSERAYKSNMRDNRLFQTLNVFTTVHDHQFIEWHDGRRANLTMVS